MVIHRLIKTILMASGLLIGSINLQAQQLAEKQIEANYKNALLNLILLDLEISYGLKFKYNEEDIKDIRTTIFFRKTPLQQGLAFLLDETGIWFDLQEPNTVVLFKGDRPEQATLLPSDEQPTRFDMTISGTVKDKLNGETLPFANLFVEGTSIGATTNVDGWFSLFHVPSDTCLIEVSYIGYQSAYYRLKTSSNLGELVISLTPVSQALQEVLVEATQQSQLMKASSGISKIAVAPAQLNAIPSLGEKDIFRSLQLLPGVSGSNESSSGLFVRGGTPDQNLVLFDGFTVYHVDHLFGFFSAFNNNAIKDVQLFKGGFEAKYGGRLSSVLDVTGKDGNAEDFNIGGGISLLSANAYTELPFDNGNGTILLGVRRSFQSNFYNNLLEFSDGDSETSTEENEEQQNQQPPFARGQASIEPTSWFYDLNSKVTYRLGKDIFSLSFYNGKDKLDNSRYADQNSFGGGPFGGGGNLDFNFAMDVIDQSDWGNTGSSAKWSRRWNDKWYSNALLSYSNYFSFRDRGTYTLIERDTITTEINNGTIEDNDLKDYSLKWDWEWQPQALHKVGFGFFGSAFDIKYDFTQNDTLNILNRDDQGLLAGAYIQTQSTLFQKLIIFPGIRTSYFDQTNKTYIEPRLQLQYLVTDQIKLKAATGRYYQFANRVIREDISQGSRDFWVLSDGENVPVSYSDHFIAGISYETSNYLFDFEAYHKKLEDITEYSTRFTLNGFGRNTSLDFEENFYNGNGFAEGIELLAQKKGGKLSGWISYTLGQVRHQFDIYGEAYFPAAHDVTNELKIVATYKLRKWSFGGTFIYATGMPYTAPLGAYTIELLDGNTTSHFAVSPKNTLRLPDYHRLDLSVNYDFDYFLGGKASAGLSFFNLYNRKNIWYKEYEVVDGVILETNVNLLGFTPSLYFNWSLK